MPQTPDEYPGRRIEDEGILFVSGSTPPVEPGEVRFVSGSGFEFYDFDGSIKGLTSGALNSGSHAALRQLIHFIQDGPGESFATSPFKEVSGVPFVSRETWWESSAMLKRIFQTEVTRSGVFPVTESYKLYSSDGVSIAASATDVITYVSNVFEATRTRTFFVT